MSALDPYLAIVWANRGKPAEYGLRLDRVYLLIDWYADGEWAGPESKEIVEFGGAPPKVVDEKFDDVSLGMTPPATIVVGPITPAFPGGGTDLTDWLAPVQCGQTRHVLRVGPSCPEGKKYRVLHIERKPLHYMIRAQDAGQMLQAFGGATTY